MSGFLLSTSHFSALFPFCFPLTLESAPSSFPPKSPRYFLLSHLGFSSIKEPHLETPSSLGVPRVDLEFLGRWTSSGRFLETEQEPGCSEHWGRGEEDNIPVCCPAPSLVTYWPS